MNKETQSVVMALLGGLLISITTSGRYTSYVKPGLGPVLIASGAILILIGLVTLVQTIRRDNRERCHVTPNDQIVGTDPTDEHTNTHNHERSRAPWLLLAPVLVLLLMAPAALGADAVTRFANAQASDVTTAGIDRRVMTFPALPPGDSPELSLQDFVLRAVYDSSQSVTARPVTVTGFVAAQGGGQEQGYTIVRFGISCCAADANPLRIYIQDNPPFPENTWVRAVVTAVPASASAANQYVPEVVVHSIQQTSQPDDPYMHPQYG